MEGEKKENKKGIRKDEKKTRIEKKEAKMT
jgi:hypothetical protein